MRHHNNSALSAELRERVRAEVPTNVLDLMDGVEAFAQQQLLFDYNAEPPPPDNPNAAACYVLEDEACILLRAGAPIVPQDILHELLHIHRYWIEGEPQLEPAEEFADADHNWDATGRIENAIEHLVIVPRESAYGFGTRENWDRGALNDWAQYPWAQISTPFERRFAWIMAWLKSSLTSDPEVARLAQACLAKEGVLDEAKRLEKAIVRRLPNKGRCLLTVTRAVRISHRDVRLAYLDVRAKRKRYAELPAA